MSLALLFPGQGVQYEGMLPWLEASGSEKAASALAAMTALIGVDWRHKLGDAAWSESNLVAQCLITGTSLAAFDALRDAGLPMPSVIAGYSVGEISAFSAAGIFDSQVAIGLAAARAAAMDRSAGDKSGGLISVSGAGAPSIEAVCERWQLQVAIRIAMDRCLLGGDVSALDSASKELAVNGAVVTRLRIRVASHTTRMAQAAEEFARLIQPLTWRPPSPLLVTNLDGATIRRVADLKRDLAGQIDHTVQWERCIETIAERRPACVLEVGAGSTLAKQWMAAHPDIPSRSADEFGSAASVVEWVRGRLGN